MRSKIFKLLIFLILAVCFIRFIRYAVIMFGYPYEWDHTEGMVLFYANRLAAGAALYKDPCTYPMVPVIYPPVYPLVLSLFSFFGNITLAAARYLSLLCAVLTGFIIYDSVKKVTFSVMGGLLAFLFFFANDRLSWWFPLCRVDIMMCFLSVFGLYLLSFSDEVKRRYIILSALVLVAAVYVKQTAVFSAAAGFMYLFYKDRRKAVEFAGIYFFTAFAVLLYLNFITEGAFYLNAFEYNRIGYNFCFFRKVFGEFFMLSFVMFSVALFNLFYSVKFRRLNVWHFYFFSGIISALFIGSPGAGTNHFLILFCPLCILFISGLFDINKIVQARWGKLALLDSAGFLVFLQLFLFMLPSSAFLPKMRFPDVAKETEIGGRLDAYIAGKKGPVLMDLNINFLMKNGKQVYYFGPPYWLRIGKAGKHVNMSRLKKDISDRRFDSIILSDFLLPADLLKSVKEEYRFVLTVPVQSYEGLLRYHIFEPKG